MSSGLQSSDVGLVERASGIIVPECLAQEPTTRTDQSTTAYDPDGRRRIVLTKEERQTINRAIVALRKRGLGIIVGCGDRQDGRPSCGQPMVNEGEGLSGGYGCKCSRVHFQVGQPHRVG